MTPRYDPVLVLVSIAIAIMASYVALDLATRISSGRVSERWAWWLGGSVAMGVGIWSMHFVGMLAFHLPVAVRYDVWLVLLSVLVAVGASALALLVASRAVLPLGVLAASGLLMGAAISGMHYIGMAAMRLPAVITWRPLLVLASIVIAVGASYVALLLAFRLRLTGGGLFRWLRLWAAMLMGIAISGMHYTAMAAAQFAPAAVQCDSEAYALHTGGMAIAVIAGTAFILSVALASASFDERTRLLAREQQARREAEAANRLKDEFLATLSHELRTPLNVMLGRTQMLRAISHDPARVIQAADAIERNGEALRHLVDDLLDVSRITLGRVQLEWQSVDLAALLESAAGAVQPGAEAKGVKLTVRAVGHVPAMMGDPARLQQVIWNLLSNGVKFTPARGEVRAEIRYRDPDMILTVMDTGQGIEPAFLPHVFDMFRQAEPTMTRSQGGLGIGLSLVRRLVELHGGTVTAASAGLGKGATFTVYLPNQPRAAEPAQAWTEQTQAI